MIQRAAAHALQHRISHLFKSVRLLESPSIVPWHSVTDLPTLDSAVARINSLTKIYIPLLNPNTAPPPPIWLLVRLCSKVRSPADAEKASHLIITNLPHIDPDLRPPVLILVVHLLSTYRVLPALDRVIELFIGLPLFHEHWHFNRLLRALARYADSPTDGRYIARLAILLLKTMTERELSLTKKTYRCLLRNRYITIELVEELRQRMIRDRIVPDRAHLESLLRIFAHHGTVHDAAAYARAIHDLDSSREKPPHVTPPKRSAPAEQIVPSNAVEYLSHLVHEDSQRSQFDADAEWSRSVKTGLSHRFLSKQNTSAASWAARLLSLSRTWSFSPENLVAFFEWSHAQRFPFRTHTTISYTIVLRGLLQKRAYTLALEVWERYRKHGTRKLRLDPIALAVGVEVLTRAGYPDRALALIESVVDTDMPRARRRISRRVALAPRAARPMVPASLVTRFMHALSVTNPSATLRLWEHMELLYGITPDALAFTIMLDAARHATLNGETLAGAMQELGFGFQFRLPFTQKKTEVPPADDAELSSLERARRRSYAKFKKSLAVSDGDMWGGERAWRRAHRIFTNALLAGWPALADVRAPARAVRASGESPATTPLRDLKHFFVPPPPPPRNDANDDGPQKTRATTLAPSPCDDDHLPQTSSSSSSSSPPLLPIHPHGAYPSFAPDDATFRAAILLLGTARAAASEIPRTLAWMRALRIEPRTRTLAYALVFWAEVSVGAPLLERLRHKRGGGDGGEGEYVRLVRWIEDWVGVGNVPDEAAVGEAMRRVDAMRRGVRIRDQ